MEKIAFGASLPVILLVVLVWSALLTPVVLLVCWLWRGYCAGQVARAFQKQYEAKGRAITVKLQRSEYEPRVTEDELL